MLPQEPAQSEVEGMGHPLGISTTKEVRPLPQGV